MISSVEWDSPAWNGGLSARDEILMVDGRKASSKSIEAILFSKKPGDKLEILVSRRGRNREVDIILKPRKERSFLIKPLPNPDPAQSRILEDWLKEK